MSDCDHRHIRSYATEDGEPVNLWACADCAKRFVPIDREIDLESALRTCDEHTRGIFGAGHPVTIAIQQVKR